MKEQKLVLEVINNKTILIAVISCIQESNLIIHEFRAEEAINTSGHISIAVEGEKENIDLLVKELEGLEGVERVTSTKTLLPSSELQNSFEE